MAVVQQQPMGGGGKLVATVEGHRDWSSGLFGCFEDFKTCIMAYFCLPCTLCNVSSRIGDCPLMPFCVPSGLVAMRTRIRTLGGIQINVDPYTAGHESLMDSSNSVDPDEKAPRRALSSGPAPAVMGSICGDCLALSFCAMCGVCQMARELDSMGL